jgi:putative oxidoreductase
MSREVERLVGVESAAGPRERAPGSLSSLLTLDAAALVLRVAFGLTLALAHGLNKLKAPETFLSHVESGGFPAPTLLGWFAILSEFVGGLLLALGLFTRPAAALVASTLFVAAIKVHANDPFAKKELALAYAAVGLAFLIGGAGRYALDALLLKRKKH